MSKPKEPDFTISVNEIRTEITLRPVSIRAEQWVATYQPHDYIAARVQDGALVVYFRSYASVVRLVHADGLRIAK